MSKQLVSAQIPRHFQPVYTEAEIAQAVARLGTEISAWADEVWKASHADLLAIPVLRGGIFFFADLVRKVSGSVEIAAAQTRAYEVGQNSVQAAEVQVSIGDVPAKGRSILLVDDICDSGRTLEVLSAALMKAGASEVRSAVLIKRILERKTFEPEYVGFKYDGPEWFVGYGMEDSHRYRNLPDIYIIRQSGDA